MDKLIWIKPKGGFGNRALQYLAAEGIRKRTPEAKITNVVLPELGINRPAPRPATRGSLVIRHQVEHRLDHDWIAQQLKRHDIFNLLMDDCWAQHLENFPSRSEAKRLIPVYKGGEDAEGFREDQLLCNVRADEILRAVHPDYVPLPPQYYRMLQERTGLDLVFFGQLGNDAYSQGLRAAFPKSLFIASRGPALDFETIRRSANIAVGISTFSWLAGWLSNAKQIFLPICGLYNQGQAPYQDFLPLTDASYRFVLFPVTQAINIETDKEEFFCAQDILSSEARWLDNEELRAIQTRRNTGLNRRLIKKTQSRKPSLRTPRKKRFDVFDRLFYAEQSAFILFAFRHGWRASLRHFRLFSLSFGHAPLLIDQKHYFLRYPDAAVAVTEGYFTDAYDHFVNIGRHKGYKLTQNERKLSSIFGKAGH